MKRFLSLVCVFILIFTVASCSNKKKNKEKNELVVKEEVTQEISADEGGTIKNSDESISIEIPDGALESNTKITMKIYDAKDYKDTEDKDVISQVVEFEPSGTIFKKPVIITMTSLKKVENKIITAAVFREEKGKWSYSPTGAAVKIAGYDEGGDPIMQSAGGDPIMLSAGGDPIMISAGGDPIMLSAGGDPIMITAGGDPIMQSAGGDPIMMTTGHFTAYTFLALEPKDEAENPENDNPDDTENPDSDDPTVIYVTCTPGETRPCYEGPSGTENVGICKAGVATCVEDGTDWGECIGQIIPSTEICSNGIDENCDGEDMTPENAVDYDGDGYNYCTGDCCEAGWEQGCNENVSPEKINPGSYELTDNYIDDNCNGQVDEIEHCDAGLSLTVGDYAGNAEKLAKAMGACAGLISAELSLAGEPVTEQIDTNPNACNVTDSCNYSPADRQSLDMPYYDSDYQTFAVTNLFGTEMTPVDGSNMLAVLSTGQWNNPTQNAAIATLGAGDMQTASRLPEDWLNMMPNCEIPKAAPSCGGQNPQDGLTNQCAEKSESDIPVGQDPIMLTLKMKVPSNARAFEFNLFFMSIEYPSTVCNENNYNDFFIALLDSTYNEKNPNAEYKNPYDKNLAKDELGNPVGVDLAPAGLFKACNPNCTNSMQTNINQWGFCTGDELLNGTGFGTNGQSDMVGCNQGHGGTGWLRVAGNVVPDETITLRLALWEQGTVGYGPDHSWDSTVVLDGFKWLSKPGKPGVTQK